MFTHVVMFKLKDRSPESILKARDVLMGMVGKNPFFGKLEVGIDTLHSERSFDLVLTSTHQSVDEYRQYHQHPVHQDVLTYMKNVLEKAVSVDFES